MGHSEWDMGTQYAWVSMGHGVEYGTWMGHGDRAQHMDKVGHGDMVVWAWAQRGWGMGTQGMDMGSGSWRHGVEHRDTGSGTGWGMGWTWGHEWGMGTGWGKGTWVVHGDKVGGVWGQWEMGGAWGQWWDMF